MKAYELLKQKGWCQGEYAKNKKGVGVSPQSRNAACFCVLGAIHRCYPCDEDMEIAISKAIRYIPPFFRRYELRPGYVLMLWNDWDGRNKQDVIEVLRKADV